MRDTRLMYVFVEKEASKGVEIPEAAVSLVKKFSDVFPDDLPDGLPPLRDI